MCVCVAVRCSDVMKSFQPCVHVLLFTQEIWLFLYPPKSDVISRLRKRNKDHRYARPVRHLSVYKHNFVIRCLQTISLRCWIVHVYVVMAFGTFPVSVSSMYFISREMRQLVEERCVCMRVCSVQLVYRSPVDVVSASAQRYTSFVRQTQWRWLLTCSIPSLKP